MSPYSLFSTPMGEQAAREAAANAAANNTYASQVAAEMAAANTAAAAWQNRVAGGLSLAQLPVLAQLGVSLPALATEFNIGTVLGLATLADWRIERSALTGFYGASIRTGREHAIRILSSVPVVSLPEAFLRRPLMMLLSMGPDSLLAQALADGAPNTEATRAAMPALAAWLQMLRPMLDQRWMYTSPEATLGAFVDAGSPVDAEASRLAAERAEADRLAAERAEADRLAAERAEADRLAAEMAAVEAAAQMAAEQARIAAEAAAVAQANAQAETTPITWRPRALETLGVLHLKALGSGSVTSLATYFNVSTLAGLAALTEAQITAETRVSASGRATIKTGRTQATAILATEPDPTLPTAFLQRNLATLAALSPDALLAQALADGAPDTAETRAAITALATYLDTLTAALDASWLNSAEGKLSFVTKTKA